VTHGLSLFHALEQRDEAGAPFKDDS
jgi:hypothetical protein